ncbi:MAG: hypothetical protein UT37_C0027G0004 [Parcubacteria group bacterium GW2011_GWA2_39_18]|nr:MAG: hypothetical protein UT37_C0027G0004 [Parcubacteria group bacterium GW2011_GWA2_39_18]
MPTITIPKNLIKEELVIIPRKEYEEFLRFYSREDRELELTASQKNRLRKSRANLAKGKYLTLHELKQKLGVKN